MPDPLHPPTEAIERLKSDAQQQRDGGCVRQADDIDAVLGYVAAIEEEVAGYWETVIGSESHRIHTGKFKGWWDDRDDDPRQRDPHVTRRFEALVALDRWERHPTKPGLYRPKPDHLLRTTKKVGEDRP